MLAWLRAVRWRGPGQRMSFTHNLAGRLFKLVFGGYVILAVGVTAVQLTLEYSAIQREIENGLGSLGASFSAGVAGAMWEVDRPLLATMARGIAQSAIVTGVTITDEDGSVVASVGSIPLACVPAAHGAAAPFQFSATRLTHASAFAKRALGQLTIYSARSVAIERIKHSFVVILINSLIKTAGLWLIFYVVINKALSGPLARMTQVVSRLEFAAEANDVIPLDYPHQDELGRLMGAMRTMQGRLSGARKQLEQLNHHLERTVDERTLQLSEALAFSETILLNSPLPMGVYAAAGQCMLANDAYAKLVGATRDTLLAQNFHDIAAWQESSLADDCAAALAQHKAQQCEINGISSFGKAIALECRILPTLLNGEAHLLIQFIDLSERKRIEDELRHYAFHDALTGLPNRRLLQDRLTRALASSKRHNTHGALLYLDLNKFKQLNDTHGHDVGDLLLVEAALRLRQAVRDCDTVARLGGDEFVVLLESLGADATRAGDYATARAEHILGMLSAEFVLGAVLYRGSASVGIKLFLGGDDPDGMLKEADLAMYQAKKRGGAHLPPASIDQ